MGGRRSGDARRETRRRGGRWGGESKEEIKEERAEEELYIYIHTLQGISWGGAQTV